MSTKAYQLDKPVRGNFTADGRVIEYELDAGEFRPKTAEDELVVEQLVALGVARPAKKRAETEKAAPAESVDRSVS